MTTFLFSLLTAGSDRMAVEDPHGWTLTIVSISIVFIALAILFCLYTLSGDILSGKMAARIAERKKKSVEEKDDKAEVAAAIAMALASDTGGEAEAAIAVAMHLYMSDAIHDIEPGVITIRRSVSSWNDKKQTFRKLPR